MSERLVYTVQQLLHLRPPRPDPVLRSAPLPIPRRPTSSPTRSPPPGRSRNPLLSASPPPSQHLLSSSFDPSTLRSGSPLLPPGFGPPRSTGLVGSPIPSSSATTTSSSATTAATANSASTVTGTLNPSSGTNGTSTKTSRGAQRIARGPNPTANFATRIAFATRKLKSTASPQDHQFSRRDIEISSEIDRLFADDSILSKALEQQPQRFPPTTTPTTAIVSSPPPPPPPPPPSSPPPHQTEQTPSHVTPQTVAEDLPDIDGGDVIVEQDDLTNSDTIADTVPETAEVRTETGDNPTVAALAKWFSSLAAAADVVEGTATSSNKSVGTSVAQASVVDYNAISDNNSITDSRLQEIIAPDYVEIINDNHDFSVDTIVGDDSENVDIVINSNDRAADVVQVKKTVQEDINIPVETHEEKEKEVEKEEFIDERVLSFFDSVLKRTVDGEMMEWAQDFTQEMVEIDFELDDLLEPPSVPTQPVTVPQSVASSALDGMMTHMEQGT